LYIKRKRRIRTNRRGGGSRRNRRGTKEDKTMGKTEFCIF
jgi:hypothetical protein